MVSLKIPEILFTDWFWLAVIAVVIVIHYFFGKPPVPPKPSKFFLKHKKAITRVTDIFVISVVVCGWSIPLMMALKPLLNPSSTPISVAEEVKSNIAISSIVATGISGSTGALIGLLSTFTSNLTKTKRIILLVISLMPILFTGLTLLSFPLENAESFRSTIKIGLGSFFWCMVVNGPAIFAGQHFTSVMWLLMRKLKLVSGERPDWE